MGNALAQEIQFLEGFVVATDRGGHLHNALELIRQMEALPKALVTTHGPDIDALRKHPTWDKVPIHSVPHQFTWIGRLRLWNPIKLMAHVFRSVLLAYQLRPVTVISLGASNVVLFSYAAWFFGAKIYHVECMSHVFTESFTARVLYPICTELYVQWEELLDRFGNKARYAGCIL